MLDRASDPGLFLSHVLYKAMGRQVECKQHQHWVVLLNQIHQASTIGALWLSRLEEEATVHRDPANVTTVLQNTVGFFFAN